MTRVAPPSPCCRRRWADEYTHHDCPPGRQAADHCHWVCQACGHEWIELLPSPTEAQTS